MNQSASTIPRLRDVDLRLLHVFTVVADCGGLSAAQVELNVSASTISIHLSELETRLDMRLCQRGRAGFALTNEGRAVYDAAQKLFSALEDFRAEVGGARGRLVGELSIGVVDNTLTDHRSPLVAALRDFQNEDSRVHVRVHVVAPKEIERSVLDGLIHVGIGKFYHQIPGLAYQTLYREELGLYCGRGHPLFERAADGVRLSDLDGAAYISRGYVTEGEAPGPRMKVRPMATAYHMEGLAMLILTGWYIGYLPTHYAQTWVGKGLIRPLLPHVTRYGHDFTIITKKSAQPTPVTKAFIAELLRHARQLRQESGGERMRDAETSSPIL